MEPNRISYEEKERMTGQACELFKVRNPDFWPSKVNAEKLVGFVERNLGMSLAEYPYPVDVQVWQDCYDYLLQNDFFYTRPVEEDNNSAQTAENQRALQAANDNLAAAKANEIRIARAMPLKALGNFTAVENAKIRREGGLKEHVQPGSESRPLSQATFGLKAQARANTAAAHPELAIDSQEWNRHYATELARLRG
jgi:hypothetical protein